MTTLFSFAIFLVIATICALTTIGATCVALVVIDHVETKLIRSIK